MIFSSTLAFLSILGVSLAGFPLIPDPNVIQPRAEGYYRLPTSVVPESYDVTLEPIFEDFTFPGSVRIVATVLEEIENITLHATELTINYESIVVTYLSTGVEIPTDTAYLDEGYEFLIIPIQDTIAAGVQIVIYIPTYTGVLNANNRGFYRASYEEDGETKWFATTQFESTSARRAFPCFDEPALKAKFTINIIRPADYTSISNMPLSTTEAADDGKEKDVFEETEIMSTYLVAFVVSQLEHVVSESGNQAVYAAKYLIDDNRGQYGLQVGIDTIAAMEEFTRVEYVLPKMYQVAIPNEWFSAGAMENWGLVTYREQYLLYKQGLSTVSEQQNVASIIAHEFGHQWFGNLVSPLWWEYIWLNEGFATYFEYYATSVVAPTMRMMDQFVTSTVQYAFESDALETTRPMSYDAQSPSEISALFDRIAYDKSGAVIRMMEHFLTTEVFRSGLEKYLTKMEFGAAQPSDLWEGLQEAIDENDDDTLLQEMTVRDIMETWNSQAGYPVVTVTKNDGEIVLSQERFLLYDSAQTYDTVWTIPINYAKASDFDFSDTKATHWLKEATENTDITVDENEWIIVNKQETGYYRVNYDDDNWNLISDHLANSTYQDVHLLSRAQLIDDALNLARSGRLNYKVALNILLYLSKETDYIPLYSFFRGLTFLHKHILNTDRYDKLKDIVKDLLQTAYDSLGTADTGTHTDKLNRINVLTWMCRYEHEDCIAKTHNGLAATTAANPDLQAIMYCGGLKEATNLEEKWTFLYNRYNGAEAESLEKSRIISALGCSRSATYLTRLLNAAMDLEDDYTIPTSHKTTAFSAVYTSSDIGLETAFDFITNAENFDNMVEHLGSSRISSIFSGISDRLTTVEQRNKLVTFIASLSEDLQTQYSTVFATALANIQTNINWSEKYMEDIGVWLDEHSNGVVYAVSIPILIVAVLSHLFM